ncbi:replicative DNA helicase [Mycobacteroides abscessus subsp. massiliense]|nr:replicative DNA helicase [Mycobacteroides abscessus subsp. massiliense]
MPTAANAGYYAGIVAERALLRRLVAAGTRIVQYGYAGADGAEVADIVDRAQAEVYDVTERRTRPRLSCGFCRPKRKSNSQTCDQGG